jgi:hypothetical protein
MKKIISTALILAVVLSLSTTAFADGIVNVNASESLGQNTENEILETAIANEQSIINMPSVRQPVSILRRGTSLPTSQWYFNGTAPYSATFSNVKAGIYTNYYFYGHDTYYVSVSKVSVSKDCKFTFFMYDMTEPDEIEPLSSTAFSASSSSNEAEATYSDLNSNHKYCVFLRTDGQGAASGTITVSYSY